MISTADLRRTRPVTPALKHRKTRKTRGACALGTSLVLWAAACGTEPGPVLPRVEASPVDAATPNDAGLGLSTGDATAITEAGKTDTSVPPLGVEPTITEAMAFGLERGVTFLWQREIRLQYPARWQGAEGITADNGGHNQGYAFDGFRHYSTAQDRAGTAWYFVHDLVGNLVCATHATSPFPPALETGNVHPGGGYLRDGWFTTVISNQRDTASAPRGAFAMARFRAPASCAQAECTCDVAMATDANGAVAVTLSDAYMGFVATGGPNGEDSYVFDIHGENAFRCGPDGRACRRVALAQQTSAAMPQQCVTLRAPTRRLMMCTPFPNPLKRAYVEVFGPIANEADSVRAFVATQRRASAEIPMPEGLLAFGEGISVVGDDIFLASGATPDANCGTLGLVSPCTSRDGNQVVRVYRLQ